VKHTTHLYGLDDRGSRPGRGLEFFTTASIPPLGPSQTPVQGPGREADHSPTFSTEVKNAPSWRGAHL